MSQPSGDARPSTDRPQRRRLGELLVAAVAQLPEQLAERYDVLPLSLDGAMLTIAMTDPSDVEALDGVRLAAGVRSVRPIVATAGPLASARRRAYRAATTRDLVRELSTASTAAPEPPTSTSPSAGSPRTGVPSSASAPGNRTCGCR